MKILFILALVITFFILLIAVVYKISVGSTQKAYKSYIKDWVKLELRNIEHDQARLLMSRLEQEYIPTKITIKAGSTLAKLIAPKKIETELYVPEKDYIRAEELINKWLAEK